MEYNSDPSSKKQPARRSQDTITASPHYKGGEIYPSAPDKLVLVTGEADFTVLPNPFQFHHSFDAWTLPKQFNLSHTNPWYIEVLGVKKKSDVTLKIASVTPLIMGFVFRLQRLLWTHVMVTTAQTEHAYINS